ncbi:hypothetical protein LOAG_19332 [Loa loa]|uniref:Uncharacterized protein n=1 Tax=Loa loa TaxID=7209 RepID=A0A1S0UCH0_LOALO|nr:hypothetical protein LOAG_19332 [Loa loa]EJD73253.1 hypothetical protein LOAG_19332 [Loa loa]
MDFKNLAILTSLLGFVVSSNITLAKGGTDEEGPSAHKNGKIEMKFRHLSDTVPLFSERREI